MREEGGGRWEEGKQRKEEGGGKIREGRGRRKEKEDEGERKKKEERSGGWSDSRVHVRTSCNDQVVFLHTSHSLRPT